MTDSMQRAIDETNRRRETRTVQRSQQHRTPHRHPRHQRLLATILKAEYADLTDDLSPISSELSFKNQAELGAYIAKLETEMRESAKTFELERAATLRNQIKDLRTKEFLFA